MDRFFDPIIEIGGFNNNYLIVETNNGRRQKPRLHGNRIIYDDFFVFLSMFVSLFFYWYYAKIKNRKEFLALNKAILLMRPQVDSKYLTSLNRIIITGLLRVSFYKWFLRRKGVKCVVSASKSSFLPLFCAAKVLNVKVVELQHGLIYGESVTYGGCKEPLFTPDKFLTFGDIKPRDVYGVNQDDVITIGWALRKYLKDRVVKTSITKDDVLVLSQNLTTDYIIDSTIVLAKENPERKFYYRCHPLEKLTEDQKNRIANQNNICLQDLTDPFLVALQPFSIVIGDDQTTAVYEASSYGKKVGILALNNKNVIFLNEEASKSFWLISDTQSFKDFLNAPFDSKPSYSIYSDFNSELFSEIIE